MQAFIHAHWCYAPSECTTGQVSAAETTSVHHTTGWYTALYVTWSSKMSRNLQILSIKIQPNKANSFFCFLLFVQSFNCLEPIASGFSPHWSLNNTLIENAKKPKIIFFDSFCLIASDMCTVQLRCPRSDASYSQHSRADPMLFLISYASFMCQRLLP